MKKLFAYFLQGLLYIAPLAITGYIIYMVFTVIDGTIQKYIYPIIDIQIPGLGIIMLFVFLTLLGLLGSTIIAKPIKRVFNKIIDKTPIIKVIYSAFRDLFAAFAGKEKKFNKPVLVKVNHISELHKLGFITESDLSKIDMLDYVAVYFPHSYNFSGEMFIVPKDSIKQVEIPSADVMKFIVSGGVADWN